MPRANDSDRRRWFLGGASGLGIAAVIVAIFLFARPDEVADPVTPVTEPPTVTVPSPPPATVVSETLVSNPPSVPTTPPTTPPAAVPTTTPAPATTAPEPVPDRAEDVRLQAGPDGVEILGPDGRIVTTEPMVVAKLGPNGSVFVQRSTDTRDEGADTRLLVVAPDAAEPVPVDLPLPFDGNVRLHDSAAVDGRWAVLLELQPPTCAVPQECIGGVYVYRPDTGDLEEVSSRNVWEGGWEQLSLSETGLIVGAETESISRSPFFATVVGATATAPTPEILGLQQSYDDCSDCPTGFAINRRGDAVAWFERDLTTSGATVTVVDLNGQTVAEAPLAADCCPNIAIPVVTLGAAGTGGGPTVPIAVINDGFSGDRADAGFGETAAVYVDMLTGEIDLGPAGTWATYE